MKQIDILVPCYNEEAVLPQFYQRTKYPLVLISVTKFPMVY